MELKESEDSAGNRRKQMPREQKNFHFDTLEALARCSPLVRVILDNWDWAKMSWRSLDQLLSHLSRRPWMLWLEECTQLCLIRMDRSGRLGVMMRGVWAG